MTVGGHVFIRISSLGTSRTSSLFGHLNLGGVDLVCSMKVMTYASSSLPSVSIRPKYQERS